MISVLASNRDTRSCSTDLRTAFRSLVKQDRVIVSVPEDERRMEVLPIPETYNQPCNQEAFYESLKHSSFINKPLHHPTFLIKPFHQSPKIDVLLHTDRPMMWEYLIRFPTGWTYRTLSLKRTYFLHVQGYTLRFLIWNRDRTPFLYSHVMQTQ